MKAQPMADDRRAFPPPGPPIKTRLAPLPIHLSPAQIAMMCAFENNGTALKSKLSMVLPRSYLASHRLRSIRRRSRSAISCSAKVVRNRAVGHPSLSERSAMVYQPCLMACRHRSLRIRVSRAGRYPRSCCDLHRIIEQRLIIAEPGEVNNNARVRTH